uniref:Uncharacterized protein n=1 Tax=Ciona intestinalis TaxID=7719 RepID=H2Y1Q9_CIOIN
MIKMNCYKILEMRRLRGGTSGSNFFVSFFIFGVYIVEILYLLFIALYYAQEVYGHQVVLENYLITKIFCIGEVKQRDTPWDLRFLPQLFHYHTFTHKYWHGLKMHRVLFIYREHCLSKDIFLIC